MKKSLYAFALASAIALALPTTANAVILGSAPVNVFFNVVHVQAQITQSVGDVECGVIVQTRAQQPVAVASAEIPLGPVGANGATSGMWASGPLPNGDYTVAVTCIDLDGPTLLNGKVTDITIPGIPTGSA